METYQKTFWKNEHGMEVPVALEDWPPIAKYLTVNADKFAFFWSEKPIYKYTSPNTTYGIWTEGVHIQTNSYYFAKLGGENSIWERP
jgi:hypothetical protein